MQLKRLSVAVALIIVMGHAGAALHDRGGGMIYDDVLNITWLKDANYAVTSGYAAANARNNGNAATDNIFTSGQMGWDAAVAWADQLVYGGYSDWRLPTALNGDGTGPCVFFNCTGSELGHMYYNNMGATAGNGILSGSNTANLALFTNVKSGVYWSGTAPNTIRAYRFSTLLGHQFVEDKVNEFYAWAVRPGDVGRAPEPGSLALLGLGLGLMGLGYARGRR